MRVRPPPPAPVFSHFRGLGEWIVASLYISATFDYSSRMRRLGPILPVLLLTILPSSLGATENPQPIIQGEFVVRFDPIEGGCWNLVASDNAVYLPTALDNSLRVDGLRVSASIRLLPLVATFCPGIAAEVVEIAPAERTMDPRFVRNRTWLWVSTITPVEKVTVPDPGRYTIRLTDDGKVQARFDCNRGGGTYDISKGKLSFGPLLSTRMACPADSLDRLFMKDLQRVSTFFILGGKLYLELPFDSGTMRFRPVP